MGETTRWHLPYPEEADTADVPADMYELATALDGVAMDDQGTYDARPVSTPENPGQPGRYFRTSPDGIVWRDNGTGWEALNGPKNRRSEKTFTRSGEVFVADGEEDYIPPFDVSVAAGQDKRIVGARYRVTSGQVTCKLQRKPAAGVATDIPGYTGIVVTSTDAEAAPAAVPLTDRDAVFLVVTAVSGNPKNLSFSVFIDSSL